MVGNHIRNIRKNAGIKTVSECARMLGISKGMLYKVEYGLKKPSSKLAAKMCELFSCTFDEIFLPYNAT